MSDGDRIGRPGREAVEPVIAEGICLGVDDVPLSVIELDACAVEPTHR